MNEPLFELKTTYCFTFEVPITEEIKSWDVSEVLIYEDVSSVKKQILEIFWGLDSTSKNWLQTTKVKGNGKNLELLNWNTTPQCAEHVRNTKEPNQLIIHDMRKNSLSCVNKFF